MTDLQTKYEVELKKHFTSADIYWLENHKTMVLQATKTYIPIEEFKDIFGEIDKLNAIYSAEKLVFDKRSLRVFNQPSMEWYFTEWKEKMYYKGLKIHRKILPQDPLFQESVRIGREKIAKAYPDRKFQEMDIQYRANLDDAIAN